MTVSRQTLPEPAALKTHTTPQKQTPTPKCRGLASLDRLVNSEMFSGFLLLRIYCCLYALISQSISYPDEFEVTNHPCQPRVITLNITQNIDVESPPRMHPSYSSQYFRAFKQIVIEVISHSLHPSEMAAHISSGTSQGCIRILHSTSFDAIHTCMLSSLSFVKFLTREDNRIIDL